MDKKQLRRKFLKQRTGAERRNIPFRLTFGEWTEIWQASGRLHERGIGAERYCMARHGDAGGYEVDNVRIVTNSTNRKEVDPKKMGRPRTVSREDDEKWAPPTGVRLSAEMLAEIDSLARQYGISRSDMIRRLIRDGLDRHWRRQRRKDVD